ncbi:MAG: ABC transporter ATP-binding protein [Planctomycetota bacterium]
MLSVENLHAGYGPIEVLKGVDLRVGEGEIVTLIGANGAGKTTLLMTLSGALPARGGKITFRGERIEGLPTHTIVAKGMSQVPEGRRIFPRLSVRENLEMGAFLRTDAGVGTDLDRVHRLFPILKDRARQPGGTLSGGEQQMLAIGRALMARPKLLLLDEPSLGLSPRLIPVIFQTIRELNESGVTILLVEQNARQALKRAHRGYVLELGRVALSDTAENLLHDPRVIEAYLGE